MFNGKIAILPCTGIGQVVGTIVRQAAYRVCEDLRPKDTALVCLPALVRGVQEDIDMIEQCPVIVIEGCKDYCASHSLKLQGGEAYETIHLSKAIRRMKFKIRNKNRRQLTEPELEAVEVLSQKIVAVIDQIKANRKNETRNLVMNF